jgi:hypothetical protein
MKKKKEQKNQTKKSGFALDDRPGSNTCESGKLERIKKCAEGGGTKYT